MSNFTGRLAWNAVEVDPTAIRGISAIRRGFVVIAVLLIGTATIGLDLAVNAATAAFLIGLMDKGRSPRATWEVMGITTAILCATTAVAGIFSVSPLALMAVMASLAFVAGISIAIDARAPQIFIFASLMTASHLTNPVDISDVPASVLLVAFAGGFQTLFALAAAPFVGDIGERRQLAATMRAIARNCSQLNSEVTGAAREGANAAAISLGQADGLIKRGDISTEDKSRYSVLLADLDVIRIEARAFTSRMYMGVAIPRRNNMLAAFALAANVLMLGASAIEHRGRTKPLSALFDAMKFEGPMPEESRTSNSIRAALANLPVHIEDILERRRVHREMLATGQPFWQRVRAAVAPDSMSLLYGYRMAAAVVLASLVVVVFKIPEGSWVAVTAMMLLRPDGTPTAPRILMRAFGTVIAVAAILVILWLSDGSMQTTLMLITVAVCLNYAFAAINYSAQTALMAMTILLLLSLTYPNPEQLAIQRLFDVFLGCALGTIFAFAMPIWKRGQLRADVAAYSQAAGDWFATLAASTTAPPADRAQFLVRVRNEGNATREKRTRARATLNTTLLEPPDAQVDVGTVGVVLSWVRRTTDAGIAAEALLRHGIEADVAGTNLAQRTRDDLHQIAAVLNDPTQSAIPANLLHEMEQARFVIDDPTASRVSTVLARAEIAAAAGLRAAYRVGPKRGK